MASITPAEKRIRTQEIREFLLNLPVAEHSPMIQYDLLVNELSSLQKLLNKLKAFIQFLAKLNPAQYLRWMHQAFASVSVTHSENQDITSPTEKQTSKPPLPRMEFLDIAETNKQKIKTNP